MKKHNQGNFNSFLIHPAESVFIYDLDILSAQHQRECLRARKVFSTEYGVNKTAFLQHVLVSSLVSTCFNRQRQIIHQWSNVNAAQHKAQRVFSWFKATVTPKSKTKPNQKLFSFYRTALCGLSSITESWCLRDDAVEFFQTYFFLSVLWAPRAECRLVPLYSSITLQLAPKQSRWINSTGES